MAEYVICYRVHNGILRLIYVVLPLVGNTKITYSIIIFLHTHKMTMHVFTNGTLFLTQVKVKGLN